MASKHRGQYRRRWRTKGGNPVSGSVNISWPQSLGEHPDPIVYACENREPFKDFRYIADTHGFIQNDFNPCFHDRYVGVHMFPNDMSWTASDGLHYWASSYSRQLLDPVMGCRSINLPLGTWLEDFSARAENHYKVLVGTDVDIINFWKEMIETLLNCGKLVQRIKNAILNAIHTFWEWLKRTANYWLSWNFAVKPTIADVKVQLSLLERARKRLKWLRARNHKDTKVHYREGPRTFEGTTHFEMRPDKLKFPRLAPPPPPDGQPDIIWTPDWLELLEIAEVEYEATVRLSSWAWIRFDVDDMLLEDLPGLDIVKRAIQGLYNPMEVAWEAIPWSWLIDYFRTEAHKLRERLKTDLNPLGQAKILGTGWTSHIHIYGEYIYRNGMTCAPGSLDEPPSEEEWTKRRAGHFLYRAYNRRPGLPEIGDNPFKIPWTLYQGSILGALILSKRRR